MRTAAWKVTCPARYTVDWACARNGGSVHSTDKRKGLTVSLSICGNAQCDQETKVCVEAWEWSFSSKWLVAKNLVGKLAKVDTRKMGPSRTLKILQLRAHSAFLMLWDLRSWHTNVTVQHHWAFRPFERNARQGPDVPSSCVFFGALWCTSGMTIRRWWVRQRM